MLGRDILILGIVQGLTEFLPISSSGHLVIVAALLVASGRPPLPELLEVSIVLHVGTLLSVLVFYRQRVWRLLGEDRRVIWLLVVGTLPAVVVGLPLKRCASGLLENPLLAGWMLPLTGLLLVWAARKKPGETDYAQLNWRQALWIGLLQAVAILPGISRSGATIAGGLAAGMRRDSSATFAFLLAIPAIGGAAVLEAAELFEKQPETSVPIGLLLAGATLSCLVGIAALWWLLDWLHRGRLIYFAWWCFAMGGAILAWQLGLFAGV